MPLPWVLERGARVLSDKSVRFTLWAPHAKAPCVRVCTANELRDFVLRPTGKHEGEYAVTVRDIDKSGDYWFVVDDRTLPDPVSRWQPHGVHGVSRIVDPSAFEWTDASWRGLALEELVIYELHVGTFTPEGSFDAIVPRLAALKGLGVSAIELMPVAQFPGSRNWGYDGVGLYAVQNSYGGPEALKRLVDATHAVGLGVILDVVYNHVGPEGNYLDAFGPYFTRKYTTPWGCALNYDDAHSDEVRRFTIDNALYWVTEYHVDGLRLDAVHGIFDFSAKHLLQDIASSLHAQAQQLGRPVLVIGESDLNDPKLIRSPAEHGFGLDAQWSDDFHHAVHSVLTGERNGYYVDFGGVDQLAAALREPFVYAGQYSAYRRRRHGAPSIGLPRRRFIVAIQNHDQVGNRAEGDRLAASLAPAQLRLAAALLLLSPYVPLIFMGEEYGETNPFFYFVSHGDERLVDAVRAGRRREFASFGWRDEVVDPNDEGTFARSRIGWDKARSGPHAQLLRLYRDLLELRREEPMLRPDGAALSVAHGDGGWVTLLREPIEPTPSAEAAALLALFNCSPAPIGVPVPGPAARAWTLRLFTDAPGYGGTAEVVTTVGPAEHEPKRLLDDRGRCVTLPPWSAALYRAVDESVSS